MSVSLTPAQAKARDRGLRTTYGITLAEYDTLLAHQNGACAICGTPASKSLHCEHAHDSGLLRGLACWPCNRLLAAAGDSVERLQAAARYLAHPPATDALQREHHTAPGRVGTKKRAKLLRKINAGK